MTVLSAAVYLVAAARSWDGDTIQDLVASPVLVAYPLVGVAILRRRHHPIGWLLVVMGALLALNDVAVFGAGAAIPEGAVARAVFVAAHATFPLFAMLVPLVGYRFPDGVSLGGWWSRLERLWAIGVVAVVAGMVLTPQVAVGTSGSVVNPLSTPATEVVRPVLELIAVATLPFGIVGAITAIVTRFVRSSGLERQQLRWLTSVVLIVLLSWPIVAGVAIVLAGPEGGEVVAAGYSILVLAAPVLGIGVAVTRYRLYDLDRLVSRTVGYGLVTLLLVATYAVVVLAAQQLLGGGEAPDVIVAGATLAVAALFRPVRQRVQSRVDRRFDRRAYDGERMHARFASSLRDQVDLDTVVTELATTTIEALRPSTVSLWLGPSQEGGR